MLLTILTPTLDCAATLAEALASAVALERLLPGEVQHLVTDAGSRDGSWAGRSRRPTAPTRSRRRAPARTS